MLIFIMTEVGDQCNKLNIRHYDVFPTVCQSSYVRVCHWTTCSRRSARAPTRECATGRRAHDVLPTVCQSSYVRVCYWTTSSRRCTRAPT